MELKRGDWALVGAKKKPGRIEAIYDRVIPALYGIELLGQIDTPVLHYKDQLTPIATPAFDEGDMIQLRHNKNIAGVVQERKYSDVRKQWCYKVERADGNIQDYPESWLVPATLDDAFQDGKGAEDKDDVAEVEMLREAEENYDALLDRLKETEETRDKALFRVEELEDEIRASPCVDSLRAEVKRLKAEKIICKEISDIALKNNRTIFAKVHELQEQLEGKSSDENFLKHASNKAERELERLGTYIMRAVKGEPSESSGVVDCVIRIIERMKSEAEKVSAQANQAKLQKIAGMVKKDLPYYGYSFAADSFSSGYNAALRELRGMLEDNKEETR